MKQMKHLEHLKHLEGLLASATGGALVEHRRTLADSCGTATCFTTHMKTSRCGGGGCLVVVVVEAFVGIIDGI